MEDEEYSPRSRNTAANLVHACSKDKISIASSNFDDCMLEQSCGWSKCKPNKLQNLNSPKWFLFFLAVFSVAQGMIINGFTNVGLSTLEKQFHLTSKQSGMIVAAKEISSLLLIAFLSYYGSFGHKPKYLGYGALLTALGSIMYVLPQAMVGKHFPSEVTSIVHMEETCSIVSLNETVHEARCELIGSSESYYLFIFIASKLLIGAGIAPLFTLGAAYIDENVKPKVAPVYLGVWYVSTSFGPGIGFVAGGSLLNVYVDLIQPPGVDLSPDDPRWIGNWWIGHLFGAVLILIASCALLAYPRSMPGAKAIRIQAIKEGAVRPADLRIQGNLKDMVPATLNLFKNMTFVFNTLAVNAGNIIATGLGPFVVKYLQAQFGVSTMKAGVASGITLIPGTAGGIFVGAYLMRKLKGKDTCEAAARYCFIFQCVAVLSVASFLIPGCNSPNIAGVHAPYYDTKLSTLNLSSPCNKNCACSGIAYNPVCGIDNITYFSPCHFGCLSKLSKTGFGECSCLNSSLLPDDQYKLDNSTIGHSQSQVSALLGECDRDCKNMIPFLCGIVVLLILNFVNAVPNKMVVMRCVPDNERAYALGVQWIIVTLLGAMPGPVLFGIFIDKSCDLWEITCKGEGNCLSYDNKKLSYELSGAILLFQILAAIFYLISWKTYRPPAHPKLDDNVNEIFEGKEEENADNDNVTIASPDLTLLTSLDETSIFSESSRSSRLLSNSKQDQHHVQVESNI